MIGVDPHKASHTAVAVSGAEEPLGELRVRASGATAGMGRALAGADLGRRRVGGLGHLLAQQLLSAGERVLDVQPKLGAGPAAGIREREQERPERRPVGRRGGAALAWRAESPGR